MPLHSAAIHIGRSSRSPGCGRVGLGCDGQTQMIHYCRLTVAALRPSSSSSSSLLLPNVTWTSNEACRGLPTTAADEHPTISHHPHPPSPTLSHPLPPPPALALSRCHTRPLAPSRARPPAADACGRRGHRRCCNLASPPRQGWTGARRRNTPCSSCLRRRWRRMGGWVLWELPAACATPGRA